MFETCLAQSQNQSNYNPIADSNCGLDPPSGFQLLSRTIKSLHSTRRVSCDIKIASGDGPVAGRAVLALVIDVHISTLPCITT